MTWFNPTKWFVVIFIEKYINTVTVSFFKYSTTPLKRSFNLHIYKYAKITFPKCKSFAIRLVLPSRLYDVLITKKRNDFALCTLIVFLFFCGFYRFVCVWRVFANIVLICAAKYYFRYVSLSNDFFLGKPRVQNNFLLYV